MTNEDEVIWAIGFLGDTTALNDEQAMRLLAVISYLRSNQVNDTGGV